MTTKDVLNNLHLIFNKKIEANLIPKQNDVYEFYFEEDDEECGLYNARLNKIIREPSLISDFDYHPEFELISYYKYTIHDTEWITLNGEIILSGGNILKKLSHGCYHISKSEDNFSKTVISQSKYIYCAFPEYYGNDSSDFNKYLISNVENVVMNDHEDYLLIETLDYRNNKNVGVYDLHNRKWIHELKEV